jgi:hypothetical protein
MMGRSTMRPLSAGLAVVLAVAALAACTRQPAGGTPKSGAGYKAGDWVSLGRSADAARAYLYPPLKDYTGVRVTMKVTLDAPVEGFNSDSSRAVNWQSQVVRFWIDCKSQSIFYEQIIQYGPAGDVVRNQSQKCAGVVAPGPTQLRTGCNAGDPVLPGTTDFDLMQEWCPKLVG